jgi:hypothetical protein
VLVAVTLLNTMAIGWFAFAPNSSHYIQTQWQQWQAKRAERAKLRQVTADLTPCLEFAMPAEPQWIYEEEPGAALKLASAKAGYAPVRMQVNNMLATTAPWAAPAQRADVPPAWATFAKHYPDIENSLGCAADLPVLFMGKRTVKGAGGETLLVIVQFEARPSLDAANPYRDVRRMNATRRLLVSTFRPGSGDTRVKRTGTYHLSLFLPATGARVNGTGDGWDISRPALLSMFTGKADPKDASHFTIPYQVNGHGGVIDGWLQAEGAVVRPQSGKAVSFGGGQRAWNMVVPPATQPEHWHMGEPTGSR